MFVIANQRNPIQMQNAIRVRCLNSGLKAATYPPNRYASERKPHRQATTARGGGSAHLTDRTPATSTSTRPRIRCRATGQTTSFPRATTRRRRFVSRSHCSWTSSPACSARLIASRRRRLAAAGAAAARAQDPFASFPTTHVDALLAAIDAVWQQGGVGVGRVFEGGREGGRRGQEDAG